VWPLEVEGTESHFAQRILAALTQVLVRLDLDLLICPVDRRVPATLAHARRTLLRSRCDAWVLLYPRRDDEELLGALGSSRKPVVCLMGSVPARPDWRCVELRQRGWMEEALRRLSQSGARSVMFIGQRPGEQDHAERVQAFRELAPRYFGSGTVDTESGNAGAGTDEFGGGNRHSQGKSWSCAPVWPATPESIAHLLDKRGDTAGASNGVNPANPVHGERSRGQFSEESQAQHLPDAIIAVDDSIALATLKACRMLGISVPQQLQIVGMDDTPEARASSPTIATFRQPLAVMATAAVELAMGQLDTVPPFEAEFISGESLREAK
jgi:DNA-binding LacI/PurR family transcriptional regulator